VPRHLEGDLPAESIELDPELLEQLDPVQRELLQAQLERAREVQQDAVSGWQALEPELLGWAARCRIELGQVDEARELVQRALEIEAGCRLALEALQLLEQIEEPAESPAEPPAEPPVEDGGRAVPGTGGSGR
jgi:hypothetical protein